ncbi:MAG: asparagine synthase (glutamine-hydrolyzing) [bacterium]
MCGIAGFTGQNQQLIEAMTTELAHRGPDQHGYYVTPDVSLGHRRLSIIDLSEHGRQPMGNEDGRVQVVFNGEIYNFQEVREVLRARGHVFQSQSDTEVIVHAYEEYGFDAIHKFRGMFAFAVWDGRKKLIWLARDRIGIKPLYYHMNGGRLIFASEIKAILKDPSVPRELNRQALYDYLGFEFVPAPETMFRDIFKLPAGHHLIWKSGEAKIQPYWDLTFSPRNVSKLSIDDAAQEVQHVLNECVKSHLISDVPLGVFLSGGLDSSALVAMMRKHITGRLRTFTIGYPDKTFSELNYAKIVADHLGTEHHVLMIEGITEADIEKSMWHFDEPMTDLSSIPLMMICGKAREQITVCLSGEGGDEVFAGYDRFKASKMNRYYARIIPDPIREYVIGALVKKLPDQAQKKGPINVLKRFVEGSCLPREGQQLRWQYFLNDTLASKLFTPSFKAGVSMDPFKYVREYNSKCDAQDPVNRELYLDTRFMMSDSVLMKVDKMSMSHSLEVRVPLLDHKFVELNAALPGNWKLKGFETKHLFRKALHGLLPDNIIHRGKQGYSLPVKNLLRDQLRDYMINLLNGSPIIRSNMDMNYVNLLIKEHLDQTHNHNHILWGMMNTAIWQQKFNVV